MKKILIVGAGFLQSFVIRKAKELGYYTYAIDMDEKAVGFADADEYAAINIVDQERAYEYAKEKQVDGVLTAATDYGVLTVAYIGERLGLPAIRYETAQRIKNKFEVRKLLYEAGVDDSGASYQVAGEEDIEALTRSVVFPVMVKPCDGSGSRAVCRVDRAEELADACRRAMSCSMTRRATVEPFVEGVEYGVESFVYEGEPHVLAVMKKWMTKPPYYAELGHAIPSGLSEETEAGIRACVTRAIRALGIDFGSVNMDLILTPGGSVHIVDIGARMGGNLIGSHLVPIGTGVDYIANMIKAAVGDNACFAPVSPKTPIATRLLALTEGKIRALPDLRAYENAQTKLEHHLAVGKTIHPYRTNLDGMGYVVCTARTVAEAAEAAERMKEQIDREIRRE